jgi:hypothetical protein
LRLAREVAHTLDVDAMLDSIEPWQFDEWMAEYVIEYGEDKPSLEDSLKTFRGMAGA